MKALLAPFIDRRSYQTLLFLLLAFPLGVLGAAVFLAGWIATLVLGLTPLVVPVLAAFRLALGGIAAAEAALARSFLAVDARPTMSSGGRGLYGRAKAVLTDRSFWRQQAYQLGQYALGGVALIAVGSLFATALGALAEPIIYHWSDTNFGSWQVDRLSRAALFVPAGLVVLVATMHLLRPLRAFARASVTALLDDRSDEPPLGERPQVAASPFAVAVHATAFAGINLLLIVIWALTGRGTFWPEWTLLWLGFLLAAHGSLALIARRPQAWPLTRALTGQLAVSATLWLTLVGAWAATTRGYFWPVWVLLGLAIAAGAHLVVAVLSSPTRRELAERVGVLTVTRAGAVEEQEEKLRRIERDLHDGAQARLVALGINLGLAEQRMRDDPQGALELVGEARADAVSALRELRDLARGIHPPVLTDRGLGPALEALAANTPLPVDLRYDVGERPAAAAETAAYFVAAEALANASKHAAGAHVTIEATRRDDRLRVEVADDGPGGADPAGGGLNGLRRRVEALDGTLTVRSPPGGPTILRAEIPCA